MRKAITSVLGGAVLGLGLIVGVPAAHAGPFKLSCPPGQVETVYNSVVLCNAPVNANTFGTPDSSFCDSTKFFTTCKPCGPLSTYPAPKGYYPCDDKVEPN